MKWWDLKMMDFHPSIQPIIIIVPLITDANNEIEYRVTFVHTSTNVYKNNILTKAKVGRYVIIITGVTLS